MGRPTSFKPEYTDLAYKFTLLGATDVQMAEYFEVSEKTLNNWKQSHPEFLQSIKKGKDASDANVAKSLYHRAIGYTHPEEKIFCTNGEVTRVDTTKHYPPDTAAAFIWLKNRQPLLWRDQKQIEVTQGKPEREMSLPEIDQRLSELQGKKAANG